MNLLSVWNSGADLSSSFTPEWWGSSPGHSKERFGSFGQAVDEIHRGNSGFQGYWSDEAQPAYQTQGASAEPGWHNFGTGQWSCSAEWHQRGWSWIWIRCRWETTAFKVLIILWGTHLLPQMGCETLDLYLSVFAKMCYRLIPLVCWKELWGWVTDCSTSIKDFFFRVLFCVVIFKPQWVNTRCCWR